MKNSVMLKEMTRCFGGKYEIGHEVCHDCHLSPVPHEPGDPKCQLQPSHKHIIKVK